MAERREVRQQELARLILKKAQQDLDLVTKISQLEDIADELVGFHLQQAIEKAIKSVLTRYGIQYNYTHDLSILYSQVEEAKIELPMSLETIAHLTPFAVQFRYMLFDEPDFDRKAGQAAAQTFIKWAKALVEVPVQPSDEQ